MPVAEAPAWRPGEVRRWMDEAARLGLDWQDRLTVHLKGDRSPVTEADREIEGFFAELTDRPAEGHYLIGEETVATRDAAYVDAAFKNHAWVVDPIDGTAPYAAGLPFWGVSLGLLKNGVFAEGAVALPAFGELWMTEGDVIWRHRADRSEVYKPRTPAWTDAGLLAVTQAVAKRGGVRLVNPVQALSCAVLPLVWLAAGRYLGYLGDLSLWDMAGGMALLRAAGGRAFLMDGAEVGFAVNDRVFDLDPASDRRFKTRTPVLYSLHPDAAAKVLPAVHFRPA